MFRFAGFVIVTGFALYGMMRFVTHHVVSGKPE